MGSYKSVRLLPLVALVVLASTTPVATAAQDSGIAGKWFTAEAIQALLAGTWNTDSVATATPIKRTGPGLAPGPRGFDPPMPRPIEPGGPIIPGFPGRRFLPAAQQGAQTPQTENAQSPSADSLAVMVELAVDKENKLIGTITFVVLGEKVIVDDGKVTGKKLTFNTTKRLNGNTTLTTWKGELTDEKTLIVRRESSTGPLPELVFYRPR